MRIAYFDCASGAAGDMLLGALVDAGASEDTVREALASLNIDGWDLAFEKVTRTGLAAAKARVTVTGDVRRTHSEIVDVIKSASLRSEIEQRALQAFELLAQAEAFVHGASIDNVHLHEVGSTDSLVDIVGCCAAFESLQPERVVVSPIATGAGTVRTEHGEYPLPAPAAAEILKRHGATVFGRGTKELVTPTGAALLATFADEFAAMPAVRIERVGSGAGDADLEWPNVVRVFLGEATTQEHHETPTALIVETNLDDMSPELLPHAIEKLLEAGAHDAWVTPIVMKKGRPAFTLSALCSPDQEATIIDVFFRETTTLGLRTTPVAKHVLEREWIETRIDGEPVRVKVGRSDGMITTIAPEHDDAVRAASDLGMPLRVVYERSIDEAKKALARTGNS